MSIMNHFKATDHRLPTTLSTFVPDPFTTYRDARLAQAAQEARHEHVATLETTGMRLVGMCQGLPVQLGGGASFS